MTSSGSTLPLTGILGDERTATLSDCGAYRYILGRKWNPKNPRCLLWVMLNPSRADALEDDPTIRRCVGYGKAWGFGSLSVVNLYAFRATNPNELRALDRGRYRANVVGNPRNDAELLTQAATASLIVCAWGAPGVTWAEHRAKIVTTNILAPFNLYVLGITKDGAPVHPLRQRKDLEPYNWRRKPWW